MNSTRASSWAPLLAAWFFVGIPHVVGGQGPTPNPAAAYVLNVGEYNRFGLLSMIRLSTDVFLDPAEARSADVRCFRGLDGLNWDQDVRRESVKGDMYLGSKIDEKYYVIEEVRIDPDGRVFLNGQPEFHQGSAFRLVTGVHRFPDTWEISGDEVDQLDRMIERAGSLIMSQQGSASSSLVDLAAWKVGDSGSHSDLLGIVTNNPDAFPCERIVNWTGEVETVAHIELPTSSQDRIR